MESFANLELSHEGVHSDDGEDQPKDDAHRQHVEDAGNTNFGMEVTVIVIESPEEEEGKEKL